MEGSIQSIPPPSELEADFHPTEDNEKGGMSEKESSNLAIDPKCFMDALRAFFQPIKNDDPRLDFYTMYKREATEYDVEYIKKYDEDLNTTLIFAGLFSAVSSAFVLDVYPKLQPDPNDQSAVLLRAILLTLNHSAIPNESLAVPPVQENPPSDLVSATVLLYASLLISLLAAFTAMLGKQWLNRYLRHTGGSMVERCGDRQRKFDGLQKWPFHLFVESLPVMLQIALLLLACGLYQYMASVNTIVAYTLFTLTGFGVVFYIGIVIAGATSYDCPFQTPLSVPLRTLWKKFGFSFIPAIKALYALGEIIEFHMFRLIMHLPHFPPPRLNNRPPLLPTARDPPSLTTQEIIPWFAPGELDKIRMKNTSDVRCVSWVIRNITDPEALDAGVRRAGTIRWFDDAIDVEPIYDLIVSTFHTCFGSDGEVYPDSRDRAYFSGRAILWIHTLAMCKSRTLLLPTTRRNATGFDDLQQLLMVLSTTSASDRFGILLVPRAKSTPSHSQWVSNVLLHQSWAQITTDNHWNQHHRDSIKGINMPLDLLHNRLLMCCNRLGFPVEEDVLKIQDKTDRLNQVLDHVTRTVTSALDTPYPLYEVIQDALLYLTKLENRPLWLTEMAYGWCAIIWESRMECEDWEVLLFLSLEVGFRCLDPQKHRMDLTHTEHHQELASAVFKSHRTDNGEVIADLLCALTIHEKSEPALQSSDIYKRYIADLQNIVIVPFSLRLRQIAMHSIALIGYKGFEVAETERFVRLLNHLHTDVRESDIPREWSSVLLEAAQSPEAHPYLPVPFWELLVKLATNRRLSGSTYTQDATSSLLRSNEWEKLECWMSILLCVVWPPDVGDIAEDLEPTMELLFRQRPSAAQQLRKRIEHQLDLWRARGNYRVNFDVVIAFERICTQAQEAALSRPPSEHASEGSQRPPLLGSDTPRELLPYSPIGTLSPIV